MLLSKVLRAANADMSALATIGRADAYDASLRQAVRATYLRLRRRRYFKFTRGDNVEDVVGARMRFAGHHTLEYLFGEIFVGLEYVFHADTPRPRIIDCGSNIGMSILFFKTMYPEASILAFEPGDVTYRTLTENIRANGWRDVTALQQAVAETEGTIDFFFDPNNADSLLMSTRAERMPTQASRQVEAVRLSRHIDGPVDFLKLDVEGAELGVLRDLRDSGAIAHVKEMVIEYHHHITRDDDQMSELLQLLESAGYGYQLRAAWDMPFKPGDFQDVLVHAYRNPVAAVTTSTRATAVGANA